MTQTSPATAWQPLGPQAVATGAYGLVTGRITSLALDPSDTTGDTLYVGTTGGGVWLAKNAATSSPANIVFTPLTDNTAAGADTADATLSIGALTVQPGGTGVLLAGTGDPNDALDSYYGAGILRSTDGGNTWTLIQQTTLNDGAGNFFGFLGEGFAGFAWSTVNPQLVVAAVSQAYEGQLVDAEQSNYSYTGLFYSKDSGATWNLARITDGASGDVQGPTDRLVGDGNPATAVVWNPVRNVFIAVVRFHGYYQSTDGITWTRLANQPGSGLTTTLCPTNPNSTGSPACPILRGALAVNPLTGDTFAWTVDLNNQDQGLWQDVCAASGGSCTNQTIAFGKQWSTTLLESNTLQGPATIANGDYNLTLAAVPSNQDTLLFAGANDLWKCSLVMGCAWQNTTNSTTCMTAKVGEYQHAFTWSANYPLEVFLGNDSGLWRSEDAIAESGQCSSSDTSHFQNLNGSIGSLAEVEAISQIGASPYSMMAALGANGTAGVKGAIGPTAQWPQILSGEGGPVAIDPAHSNNWYVNNGAGVSIHLCSSTSACTPSAFGNLPAVSNANVGNDGLTMTAPAPFLVDPADPTQLLIGTCRVWRGPASGSGWTSANAISPMLDGNVTSSYCNGNALIRSMAAAALPGGGEVVYVGAYGSLNGGGTLPGHVLTATMSKAGVWSSWLDLTLNPVTNNLVPFNEYGLDISSIYIDPHDTTGQTIYVTIAGIPDAAKEIGMAYRSTDGGAHWTVIGSNLPFAPANAIVVDPVDANTVYLASDLGVFSTRNIASCAGSNCWAAYGSGLPESPVIALSAAPPSTTPNVLVAATYGRGLWQIPLLTAGTQMTTAAVSAASLAFAAQPENSMSTAQTITLTNTGGIGLGITPISVSGNFGETDNCANQVIDAGSSCSIRVTFAPQSLGAQSGQLTIAGNISSGSIAIGLSGTGTAPNPLQLTPPSIDFGSVEDGVTSAPLQIAVQNTLSTAISVSNVTVTGPFLLSSNVCGTSIAPNSSCQLKVEFQPASPGLATGALTMTDGSGTQVVQLTGTGTAPPTDALSTTSLKFPGTIIGVNSAPQIVTIGNSGGNPLTSIAVSVSPQFQQSNNCTTQLSGGQNCSVSVTFLPTAAGAQTGALTIADILHTQTVVLSGTGLLPPVIAVSPSSLDFGSLPTGSVGSSASLTITNSGGASMSNIGFEITGPSSAQFSVGATTCGAALDPGATCTVKVVFTPAATAVESAVLTISSSMLGVKAVSVSLTGAGTSPAVASITPALLNFPATGVNAVSSSATVTIADTSSAVALANVAVTVSAGFQLTANTCGSQLAAGGSCTASVAFAPTSAGAITGALTLTSSTLAAPVTAPLAGTGFDFAITGPGSLTQTVSSGSTATFTLALAPSPGSAATFTFQCNSLPSYASCTFNPTQNNVAANATGTEIVQISTKQSTTGALVPIKMRSATGILLACGALLLPFARHRRKLLVVLFLAFAVTTFVSCCGSGGGGGGTSPSNPGGGNNTPAGTYSIPVVVSANGEQHTVTLTLVVD